MASSLIDSLSGDFQVGEFEDDYRQAVADLIEYKREHGGGRPAPEETAAEDTDDMTDLLTALRRSVEAAGGKADAPGEQEAESPAKAADEEPKPSKKTAKGSKGSKGSTSSSTTSTRSRRKKTEESAEREQASKTG